MKNRPLSRSFRSATQATDSTRNGCTANTAATKALGHKPPVIRQRTRKSRIADGRVQHDVGQVMHAGMSRSVELAIECMRQPGERMPIGWRGRR